MPFSRRSTSSRFSSSGIGSAASFAAVFILLLARRDRFFLVIPDEPDVGLRRVREALERIRPVVDRVAEDRDLFRTLRRCVGEHGLERFEVAVDVREDRYPHRRDFSMSRRGL